MFDKERGTYGGFVMKEGAKENNKKEPTRKLGFQVDKNGIRRLVYYIAK